jgi:hypothetical protein
MAMSQDRSESLLRTILGSNPGVSWLLLALIAFFIVYPLIPGSASGSRILDAAFSAMLVFSAYAVSHQRKVLVAAVILSLPTIGFWWSGRALESPALIFIALALFAIFFLFIIAVLLRSIMTSDKVTVDTIYTAISAYLLIGVAWAFFYAMVEVSVPGAFDFGPLATYVEDPWVHAELRFFGYYSLVTLSTLGYGDITPLTSLARSLSAMEAITGQLFIAVLIARLVGVHVAQSRPR